MASSRIKSSNLIRIKFIAEFLREAAVLGMLFYPIAILELHAPLTATIVIVIFLTTGCILIAGIELDVWREKQQLASNVEHRTETNEEK